MCVLCGTITDLQVTPEEFLQSKTWRVFHLPKSCFCILVVRAQRFSNKELRPGVGCKIKGPFLTDFHYTFDLKVCKKCKKIYSRKINTDEILLAEST
jgi:hypothetical protein